MKTLLEKLKQKCLNSLLHIFLITGINSIKKYKKWKRNFLKNLMKNVTEKILNYLEKELKVKLFLKNLNFCKILKIIRFFYVLYNN